MKIQIDPARSLAEVQMAFGRAFPYLKIEFYYSPPELGAGFSDENRINPFKTFAEIGYSGPAGVIELNGDVTVAWLEMAFDQRFRLCVRVFRMSGDQWAETISTQGWTLEKQNTEAVSSQKNRTGTK